MTGKVTLAQLREQARRVFDSDVLEEPVCKDDGDYWSVEVAVTMRSCLRVDASTRQKARKLMLQVLTAMPTREGA